MSPVWRYYAIIQSFCDLVYAIFTAIVENFICGLSLLFHLDSFCGIFSEVNVYVYVYVYVYMYVYVWVDYSFSQISMFLLKICSSFSNLKVAGQLGQVNWPKIALGGTLP